MVSIDLHRRLLPRSFFVLAHKMPQATELAEGHRRPGVTNNKLQAVADHEVR